MTSQQSELVIESVQRIESEIGTVWTYVTNVDVTAYPHPAVFRILGVPRPLRAELTGAGVGASRTAWFDNGKRFIQAVLQWQPPAYFRFSFTADPGFRAGYLFDLSCGPFRLVEGWYRLEAIESTTTNVLLGTRYVCSINGVFLIPVVIRGVLRAYQKFLLRMIQRNCERGAP